jgi:hypothetical protein
MTGTLRSAVLHRLGWCPNHTALQAAPVPRTTGPAPENRDGSQPGTAWYSVELPPFSTTVAIVILFSTLFVGGNIWWPPLVFAIAIAGVIIVYRKNLRNE